MLDRFGQLSFAAKVEGENKQELLFKAKRFNWVDSRSPGSRY
jgi:hypothetical protein